MLLSDKGVASIEAPKSIISAIEMLGMIRVALLVASAETKEWAAKLNV